MTDKQQMVFGGGSVAERYDDVLVPIMFDPWAEMLLGTLPPESSWDILDLATGTGIVASKLAARLDGRGSLTATDISPDMLAVAKARLGEVASAAKVTLIETPAHPLGLADASVDAIYCQQGFQFFPDGDAAAAEMHRVSRPGGRVAVSAWCPLSECEFFGMIADCLREIGEDDAAAIMSVPFEHMPRARLEGHFASVGFENVSVERVERDLVFERGIEQAYETILATPVAPKLLELADDVVAEFRALFTAKAEKHTKDGVTKGQLASLVLTAAR